MRKHELISELHRRRSKIIEEMSRLVEIADKRRFTRVEHSCWTSLAGITRGFVPK